MLNVLVHEVMDGAPPEVPLGQTYFDIWGGAMTNSQAPTGTAQASPHSGFRVQVMGALISKFTTILQNSWLSHNRSNGRNGYFAVVMKLGYFINVQWPLQIRSGTWASHWWKKKILLLDVTADIGKSSVYARPYECMLPVYLVACVHLIKSKKSDGNMNWWNWIDVCWR